MTGAWEAERDAYDAAQTLAGMVALLLQAAAESGGDRVDYQRLISLAESGEAAAGRVVAFLRDQRAAGDGDMAMVPTRLAPWRDWVPQRGHLFGAAAAPPWIGEVPQPRRCDPGE